MNSAATLSGDGREDEEATRLEQFVRTVLHSARLDLEFTIERQAPAAIPRLCCVFTGRDVPALLARNAELLLALEHLATQLFRLEPEEHEQISFDARSYKQDRLRRLQQDAETAVRQVRLTGRPFQFRSMNSRERRLLHLALASSGLATASEGEGVARHLVLHPAAGSE